VDLIVAEKPTAAKAIAEALGGFRMRDGFYESREWLITWAVGHLLEFCEPEEYEPAWTRWRLEDLPILPRFRIRPVRGARDRLKVIAALARRANGLVNACDAAREGELIFRQVVDYLGLSLPVRRLWISSLTREAIRRGFNELRPAADYDRLYQSAECRARGDWLVGINCTRAFSCRVGGLFPVGRVQTPTLAMIVEREEAIAAFVVRDFWEVRASFVTPEGARYTGRWTSAQESRLFAREAAEAVGQRVVGRPGQVEAMEEKTETENPALLFDLTSLQREANRRWGMTASAALGAAQRLYEGRLITYPRTDSRFLTPDVARTAPRIIAGLADQKGLAAFASGADPKAIYGHGRVVNPRRVADHHAIIPTGEKPGKLAAGDERLYELVARRFLAQFYPPAIDRLRRVITTIGGDRFETAARTPVQIGWRRVDLAAVGSKATPDEVPSGIAVGDSVLCVGADLKAGRTEPPRRYTEGTLLAAMESAGQGIEDEALREAMKGRGLGTPATRAAIIDRLKDVGYIENTGRFLKPTAKGTRLIALARLARTDVLLSPQLTGEWEERINAIQTGQEEAEAFQLRIVGLTTDLVERIKGWKAGNLEVVEASSGDLRCPLCGDRVELNRGVWVCARKEGRCAFRVGSWILGRRIEAHDIEELCRNGRTRPLSGFRSRNGRRFTARLVVGPNGVGFEFARKGPLHSPPRGTE